jgi:hypothetical protein
MAKTITVTGNAPAFATGTQIAAVGAADAKTSQRLITLVGGMQVVVSGAQYTSFNASVGDYYIIPSEGHPYLSPKSTFLQTYVVSDKPDKN